MANLLFPSWNNWFFAQRLAGKCQVYFAHTGLLPPLRDIYKAYVDYERTARQSTWKKSATKEIQR